MPDHGRRISIEELNRSKLLAHAAQQARKRKYDDFTIVDVDSHHYESEHSSEILPFMENDVLKQLAMSQGHKMRGGLLPSQVGYQDMGGRVTRYPARGTDKTAAAEHRDRPLRLPSL